MMQRLREIGLSCALLAACDVEDDIVAQPAGRAEPSPLGGTNGGVPAVATPSAVGVPPCAAELADTLFVVTKENGRVYRVSARTGKLDDRGIPVCTGPGAIAAAVDTRGTLWIARADGAVHTVDPNTLECKLVRLTLAPQVMTFGFDPGTGQERLYALEATALKAVDLVSREPRTLGKLDASWLGASRDGQLFAVSIPTSGLIVIDEFVLRDGSVRQRGRVPSIPDQSLSGAALHASGFALFFGGELYRLPLDAGSVVEPVGKVFDGDPGSLAVAAAPCASPPK